MVHTGALILSMLANGAMAALAWSTLVRPAAGEVVRLDGPPQDDEIDRSVTTLAAHPAARAGSDRGRQQVGDLGHHLDCLVNIADLLTAGPPSGFSLHKALQELGSALDLDGAGLRLSPRTRGALRCADSLLAAGAVPVALADDRSESVDASTVIQVHRTPGGRAVRCLTVPLRRGEETVAVLALQTSEADHFDLHTVRVTRIAAMLMSLSLSEVSRGREESRGALLEERAAIARELHDSLAQSLAFLKIQVAQLQVNLRGGTANESAARTAAQVREGVSSAYRQVKELIAAFRVRMGPRGLGQALHEAVEEFGLKGGLAVELDDRLTDCRLTVNEEFHLLQVIREALSNVVRHAAARSVTVTLSHAPGGAVTAMVDDDGRGFAPDASRPSHFGLAIMGERASSLGGTLSVSRRPEGGTRVYLVFTPEATAPERVARGL